MWLLVPIEILIHNWDRMYIISKKQLDPLPLERKGWAAREIKAVSSLPKRFFNALFKNYPGTHWGRQMLATITLKASHYYEKQNRKKIQNLAFSIKRAFNLIGKRIVAESCTEFSQSKQEVREGRHAGILQDGGPLPRVQRKVKYSP